MMTHMIVHSSDEPVSEVRWPISTPNPVITNVSSNDTGAANTRNLVFSYVSYIGWGLSILSLVVTVATYLALRTLRSKTPSRILICFSLSLLCLYIVFVAGIRSVNSRVGCIVVAALLHYFTLTSVAWMNMESYAVYLRVVKLSQSQGTRFFLTACLIAWGLPLVIVAIVASINNSDQYESDKTRNICFMATPRTSNKNPWAFFYLNLLLIFIIVFFNFLFLVNVIRELVFGRNFAPRYGDRDHDKQRKQAIYRTFNDVIISILFVLTWVFGTVINLYQGHDNTSYTFAMLFCLCYFLQGFCVFLLFCVRLEEVRNLWKVWFFNFYKCLKYLKEPLYMIFFIVIMYLTLDILNI